MVAYRATRTRLHLAEVVAVDVLEATALALSVESRAEPDAGAELLDLLDSDSCPIGTRSVAPRIGSGGGRPGSTRSRAWRCGWRGPVGSLSRSTPRWPPSGRAAPGEREPCLIQVHLAEGNVYEARRVLELHRQAIRADLGIEPSAQLVALVTVRGTTER